MGLGSVSYGYAEVRGALTPARFALLDKYNQFGVAMAVMIPEQRSPS